MEQLGENNEQNGEQLKQDLLQQAVTAADALFGEGIRIREEVIAAGEGSSYFTPEKQREQAQRSVVADLLERPGYEHIEASRGDAVNTEGAQDVVLRVLHHQRPEQFGDRGILKTYVIRGQAGDYKIETKTKDVTEVNRRMRTRNFSSPSAGRLNAFAVLRRVGQARVATEQERQYGLLEAGHDEVQELITLLTTSRVRRGMFRQP